MVKAKYKDSYRDCTLLMKDLMRTLEEELDFQFDQDRKISFPVVLSFTDDVVITSDSLSSLDIMFDRARHFLNTIGLKIKSKKTKSPPTQPVTSRNANNTCNLRWNQYTSNKSNYLPRHKNFIHRGKT